MSKYSLLYWRQFAFLGMDDFPHEYAAEAAEWLDKDNPEGLFFEEMGLSSLARRDWDDILCPGTLVSLN